MPSSGMWRRVAVARRNVSEERIAAIIRVEIISQLGTTLAVPEDGILRSHRCGNLESYINRQLSKTLSWSLAADNDETVKL
jgi:hypothetical protein